ncbi:hypothetical protein P3T21_006617 [Paraburkholderia sp. GAS334]
MTRTRVLTLTIATISALSTSAFASGYGPAPFYHPLEGSPASQRGVSAQTVVAEQAAQAQTRTAKATEDSRPKVAQVISTSQAQQ